jgi:prophage tail gpP-like protein
MSKIIVNNLTKNHALLWRRVKINKSLDNICHTLKVELSPAERAYVNRHDKIQVRFQNQYVTDSREAGGRLVTTVYVDEVTASVDEAQNTLTVIGRSPARDIIDSTWSESFQDMTLLDVAKQIAGKFGIDCFVFPEGTATGQVPSFGFENESPWAELVQAADSDSKHFILTSSEAGGLYLWQVGPLHREYNLTEGGNIKSIQWTENGAEQFHEYIITGGGGDPVSAVDNTVKNRRVLTINMTDPDISFDKIKERAQTEMRRRKENRTVVTVSGWGLTDSQIKALGGTAEREIFWIPNLLIPVKIPTLGLSRNMLISEVTQEAAAETMTSTITLVNKEAYL